MTPSLSEHANCYTEFAEVSKEVTAVVVTEEEIIVSAKCWGLSERLLTLAAAATFVPKVDGSWRTSGKQHRTEVLQLGSIHVRRGEARGDGDD